MIYSDLQSGCESHKVTGYSNVPYKAIKDEIVFFCGCKKSSNKPLCDSQLNCKSE